MAKFFAKYDIINLKILNKEINKMGSEDIMIDPKYLGMSYMKTCDFCDNANNENTLTDEIFYLFGYQICEKCHKKNIGITYIKKWYVDNNSLPFTYFLENISKNHALRTNKFFTIQRSSGRFENNWYLDFEKPIQYKLNEGTEDLLIPLYRASNNSDNEYRRSVNKKEYLSEMCRFNNLNEKDILEIFNKLFEEYQN